MNTYKRIAGAIRMISRWASVLAMVVAFVIMLVLVTDIVLRLVTDSLAVTGSYELTEMAMVIIVFLGFAVTQVEGEHVRVTMIVDRLPLRARGYANAFSALFGAVVCAIVFYAAVKQALSNSTSGITTAVLFIPIAPFAWIMALGLLLLTLALLLDAVDHVVKAVRKEPDEPKSEIIVGGE